ncbi:hypothetical protein AB0M28_30605 [Streptomyces sp. NPDC051940]|uniref:hypothetical protein n=1 Tax=Streptomyces sp. NPDC051940 TaxID=3155675 RepID=UPI00341F71BB
MSDATAEQEPPRESGGLVIGSMSGGAVAQGSDAEARDESRREARPAGTAGEVPAPPAVPPPAVPPPGAGGLVIGSMSGGAVAQGDRARAVDASVAVAGPDAERLLAAVRELRRDLLGEPDTGEADELERELAGVADEVRQTGRADRSRLARLRERLEVSSMAAAIGASAAAVSQAIAQLLG